MARFTYAVRTWDDIDQAQLARGLDPVRLALWLGVRGDTLAHWRDGSEAIPTWFAVASAAQTSEFETRYREIEMADFMKRWGITPRTLARLMGVNPTTAKRWANGQLDAPYYLGRVLGLLDLPGGMSRARLAVSELITSDRFVLPGTLGVGEAV
jgi:hypothetical protein